MNNKSQLETITESKHWLVRQKIKEDKGDAIMHGLSALCSGILANLPIGLGNKVMQSLFPGAPDINYDKILTGMFAGFSALCMIEAGKSIYSAISSKKELEKNKE